MTDEVKVLIGGENSEAIASIAQVREVLQGLTSPLRAVRDNLGEIAEAFIAAFAVEKIDRFIETMTELGASVDHATHELGMSAEQISTLNVAFEAMGLGSEGATRAIERLEYNISYAAHEASGPAALAFKALGVSMSEIQKMSPQQVLELLADKFSKTADGANKTAIAIALLGRSGAEMIPWLDRGVQGLDEFNAVVERTGSGLTNEMAAAAQDTSEKFDELKDAARGLGESLFTGLEPAINAVVDGLSHMIEKVNDLLGITKQAQLNGLMRQMDDLRALIERLEQEKAQADSGLLAGIFGNPAAIQQQIDAAVAKFNELQVQYQKIKDELYADSKAPPQNAGKPQLPSMGGPSSTEQQQSMLQQWREALQQRLIDEGNFFKSSQTEELAYWQSKLSTVKEYMSQYGLTEKQAQQLHLQVQTEIFNLDKSQAAQWLAAYKEGITQQEDALKVDLASKEISEKEYYQRSLALAGDWANLMAQIYGRDSAQYRQALTQREQLDRQHAAQQMQVWQNAANTISNAFDGMLRGVLQGTQTWQQAMQRMVGNLVIAFIEGFAKILISEAANAAGRLALELTTDEAITDARIAQIAAGKIAEDSVDISPSVLKHAGSAAAAVYDDVAQIPYVGWILAPPAAAAAFAAVAAFSSFDVGAYNLPRDMIAQVHAGEMIIPAGIAAQIRSGGSVQTFASGMSALAGDQGGGGGRDVAVHFHISAMDGQSVINTLKNHKQTISNIIRDQIATGHLKPAT